MNYAYTYLDCDGNPLDGGKTYNVHVPPNVPAKDFWSFINSASTWFPIDSLRREVMQNFMD